MKVVRLTVQNRAVAILLAILIVALLVILLTVGAALVAGLAITGAVIGTAAAVYRRLRGKADPLSRQRLSSVEQLDPSLEIRPTRAPTVTPLRPPDK